MDLYVTELPEVGLPGCCLLQECWEAAGVSTGAYWWMARPGSRSVIIFALVTVPLVTRTL